LFEQQPLLILCSLHSQQQEIPLPSRLKLERMYYSANTGQLGATGAVFAADSVCPLNGYVYFTLDQVVFERLSVFGQDDFAEFVDPVVFPMLTLVSEPSILFLDHIQ
jgi:hypothetical protein